MCVRPSPSSSISARIQTKGYSPPTVTRLHRYEWNSNWPRNVQRANGSAMQPDWPALCLVCQGEGLFGLHLEGLCVCDGGEGWDKEQAGQTQVHISEAALGSAARTSLSERGQRETETPLSLRSRVFFWKGWEWKWSAVGVGGNKTRFFWVLLFSWAYGRDMTFSRIWRGFD